LSEMKIEEWERSRRAAISRLLQDIHKGLVDSDIQDWLLKINSVSNDLFTTSSCSGRIVVLRSYKLTDKRGSKKIFVEHDPERCMEICKIIRYCSDYLKFNELIWVSLQPPVIHFKARNETIAKTIVSCARESGFIRACYREEGIGYYFVEVSVHDKLHIICPVDCSVLLGVCEMLYEYKKKLYKFEKCMLNAFMRGHS